MVVDGGEGNAQFLADLTIGFLLEPVEAENLSGPPGKLTERAGEDPVQILADQRMLLFRLAASISIVAMLPQRASRPAPPDMVDQEVHGDATQKADRIASRGKGRTRTGAHKYLLCKVGRGIPANASRKEAFDSSEFLAVKGLQYLFRTCVLTGRPAGQHGGVGVILPFPGGIIGFATHLSGMVARARGTPHAAGPRRVSPVLRDPGSGTELAQPPLRLERRA